MTCVSAIDNKYNKLGMANWGSIIDYLAPGEDIPVLWVGSRTSLGFYSGTSFAAPHVAGIAATFISVSRLHEQDISNTDEDHVRS